MRRLAILVCLTALALMMPSASSAQTVVYDYDDGEAWWNAYGCPEMKILLPVYTDADGDGAGTAAETNTNHEKRVCVMYKDLPTSNKLVIERLITATDEMAHATHKAWWDAQEVLHRQMLGGALAISPSLDAGVGPGYAADLTGAADTGAAAIFDPMYDDLTSLAKPVVNKAGDALSGRGAMTEEEAPALPLAGVGLLGLLLAGRGAWLRRRA